jgi:hypothetical protein
MKNLTFVYVVALATGSLLLLGCASFRPLLPLLFGVPVTVAPGTDDTPPTIEFSVTASGRPSLRFASGTEVPFNMNPLDIKAIAIDPEGVKSLRLELTGTWTCSEGTSGFHVPKAPRPLAVVLKEDMIASDMLWQLISPYQENPCAIGRPVTWRQRLHVFASNFSGGTSEGVLDLVLVGQWGSTYQPVMPPAGRAGGNSQSGGGNEEEREVGQFRSVTGSIGNASATCGDATLTVSSEPAALDGHFSAEYRVRGAPVFVGRFIPGLEQGGAALSPACKFGVLLSQNRMRYSLTIQELSGPARYYQPSIGRDVVVLFSPDESLAIVKSQDDFAGGVGFASIEIYDLRSGLSLRAPGPGVRCTQCADIAAVMITSREVEIIFDGRSLGTFEVE